MQNSKLINYLKKLSKKEFLGFKSFVSNPFFNKNKKVIKLFNHVAPYYKEFNSEKLDKEIVFDIIFPGESYKRPKINDIINKLKAVLDDYLMYLGLKNNPIESDLLKLKAMQERNIDQFIPGVVAKIEKKLAAFPLKDMNYYQYEVQLNYTLHSLYTNQRFRKGLIYLQNTMNNLDLYFCAAKLRVNYDVTSAQKMFKQGLSVYQVDTVKELLTFHKNDNPLFQIYLHINQLSQKPDLPTYLLLKDLIIDNIDLAKQEEQVAWFVFLMNYNIRNTVLTKEFNTLNEKFEIYKLGLEKGYFLEDNKLLYRIYINILFTASGLHKYQWIEQFMIDYIPKLKKEYRTNIKKLSSIHFFYAKKDYEEVVKIINNQKVNDYMKSLNLRTLRIKAYYQLEKNNENYTDLLDNALLAFKRFLQRQPDISDRVKNSLYNFIKMLEIIVKNHNVFPKRETKKNLFLKLEELKSIASKYWLIKVIENL